MIKQAQAAGVTVNQALIEQKEYNTIKNPIVHDSVWDIPVVYTMGSEFRWADDASSGFSQRSIFNTYDHLELNWNDTKMFQNPENRKFDKVEEITRQYMLDPNAKFAFYPTMMIDPLVYAHHHRYTNLKDGSLLKGGNVLMANEKNKVMKIGDYVTWLNCNYGLRLDTTVSPDIDKSLPNPFPDMDECVNLGIKYFK